MEKTPKFLKAGATVGSSLLLLTGCGSFISSVEENEKVKRCTTPDGTLMEATTDPSQPGYQKATDPALLAVEMRNEAEEEIDNESYIYARRTVGIGEVACEGNNKKLYLTDEGARLSLSYKK